jgi:hypothetical protein
LRVMPLPKTREELRLSILDAMEARSLCNKYGTVKSGICQGMRDISSGICHSIVYHWILSGLEASEMERREKRKKIRDEFKTQKLPAAPQYMIDDQKLLNVFWGPQPPHFACLDRQYISEGNIVEFVGDRPKVMTGLIAHLVRNHGSPGAAYFLLRLFGGKDSDHAVGLKRGKSPGQAKIQHYSLIDPNYFEVTSIVQLEQFIEQFANAAWIGWTRWSLASMTKKKTKEEMEEIKAKERAKDEAKEQSLEDLMSALKDASQ